MTPDQYFHPDDLIYESDVISFNKRDWNLCRYDKMTKRYCIPFYEIEKLRDRNPKLLLEHRDGVLKHI